MDDPPASSDGATTDPWWDRCRIWLTAHSKRFTIPAGAVVIAAPAAAGLWWKDWTDYWQIIVAVCFLLAVAVEALFSIWLRTELELERRSTANAVRAAYKAGRREMYLFASEVAGPVVGGVAKSVAGNTNATIKGESLATLRHHVLQSVRALLFSPPDTYMRVNYYRLRQHEDNSWVLQKVDDTRGNARQYFTQHESDPEGRRAIEHVLNDTPVPCLDIANDGERFGIDPTKPRGYEGFISVPVGWGCRPEGRPYGMMSVNTPKAGTLTDEDLILVQAMAHHMAVVEALTPERAWSRLKGPLAPNRDE